MIKIIFHRGPMQQGSIAAFSTELVVFCNDFTAKHSQPDRCSDGHAFIWRIAAGRVQVLFGKGPFTFRVDEDEVGIAAGQQRPFARVQTKKFRHIGTGDLDEPFQGQPPFRTPSLNNKGIRSSTPDTPPGHWRKSLTFSCFSAIVKGQWSVATVCTVPSARACHKARLSSSFRSGGASIYLMPSRGPPWRNLSSVNTKYCGHVSL